jgi:hypothetical protein
VAMGPVDIVTVKFPTTRPGHGLAEKLGSLAADGTVRILDLLFVAREVDGTIAALNIENLGPELDPHFAAVVVAASGKIDQDDIDDVAEFLEPGTSAAIIVWENTWAAPFAEGVLAAGGDVIDFGRLPREAAEVVFAELTGE